MNAIKLINSLKDPDSVLFFVPSPCLREAIAKGTHPIASQLPQGFVEVMLEGNGIKISSKMVSDYFKGRLDEQNTFILRQGDIRLLNDGEILCCPGETIPPELLQP